MNTILLRPTGELLFPEDWLPMEPTGRRAGLWEIPELAHRTLRHALLRSARVGPQPVPALGGPVVESRFGSLVTAGPFPVDSGVGCCGRETWYFPRPVDAAKSGSVATDFRVPRQRLDGPRLSGGSTPPQRYPAPDHHQAGSSAPEAWISESAYAAYLMDSIPGRAPAEPRLSSGDFLRDDQIIPLTRPAETVAGERWYSVQLADRIALGIIAESKGVGFHDPKYGANRIAALLDGEPGPMTVGTGRRVCEAEVRYDDQAHLPRGLSDPADFHQLGPGRYAIKWILLSPAIWPEVHAGVSRRGTMRRPHPGGWLPNWVASDTSEVLLRTVTGEERCRRRALNEVGLGYRTSENSGPIGARLVAACLPPPLLVSRASRPMGSEPTELVDTAVRIAIPAGAVYYFEADSPEDATALACALNWHGARDAECRSVHNRRSTLLGEKGYGLGVCGTWREAAVV